MAEIISAGDWIQKRRNALKLTRNELALLVACSPDTIKKIERDLRRPSIQIGEILATHLQIPTEHQARFLQLVRGEFVDEFIDPVSLKSEEHSVGKRPLNKTKVLNRLESLPDQKLFGIEKVRKQVIRAVEQKNRPWLVSIDGLGGIGKTTLADKTVRSFLSAAHQRFNDIGWISAKQEEYVTGRGMRATGKPAISADQLVDQLLAQLATGPYPIDSAAAKLTALTEILQKTPTLIVIDNLETIADYEALLPILRHLAQPSKFLITSRMSLQHESDIVCHSLTELSQSDALAFLQYEAEQQQIRPLMAADTDNLSKIYETVGGNPLALKLVIGQSAFLPLDHILDSLKLAKETQVDQLYRYIYLQAWEMLDPSGRKLFLSLPIASNGTFHQLHIASRLDLSELQAALASLRSLSLVEVGGDLSQPRYRLHRLTETFLMNEVIKWQEPSEIEQTAERTFFDERIHVMLDHWKNNEALQAADVEKLDREKEGILKAIQLGLEIDPAWAAIRELILALTSFMERRGYWQEWQTIVEKGLEVAERQRDRAGELELLTIRGRLLQNQKKMDAVVKNYVRVIRQARQLGDQIAEARACSNLGFALIERNHWWRSEVFSCHALKIFEDNEHLHGQAHTNNHLGVLSLYKQDFAQAESFFMTACSIWEKMGPSADLHTGLENLGHLYAKSNRPLDALKALEEALDIAENYQIIGSIPIIYINFSVTHLKLGNLALATNFARRAEGLFKEQANLFGICKAWENLGLIEIENQKWKVAEHYFESAQNGFKSLNVIEDQIRITGHKLKLFRSSDQVNQVQQIISNLNLISQGNLTNEQNQFINKLLKT
ncbi:MAG: tetratricopeptide repeat protein [Anaerolineae bacterium]